MIYIKLNNGNEYGIQFSYMKGKTKHDHRPRAAMCTIFVTNGLRGRVEESPVLGRGRAYCCKADQFKYETARCLTLARAMESNLPRECRTAIWQAYHARKTNPS